MPFTQANRFLKLRTALGEDVLLIRSFTCSERISGLYSIQVSAAATPAGARQVKAADLIGTNAAVLLFDRSRRARAFHGIVRRLAFSGKDDDFFHYSLEIVPWFWRLSQRTDCRIYQNRSVPEIIEQLLGEFHCPAFRMRLEKQHTAWDYCVQYRESFFHFISRLCEREAIYYYFEHTEDGHTLVFADSPSGHRDCPLDATALFAEGGLGEASEENVVNHWQQAQDLRPGQCVLRDHNFQLPNADLEAVEPSVIDLGGSHQLELFDYPGGYASLFVEPDQRLDKVAAEGNLAVRRRMQAEEAAAQIHSGGSTVLALASGHQFRLTRHFERELNRAYVLTEVRHEGVQTPGYVNNEAVDHHYRNSFSCIPLETPYVPPRLTPQPRVAGPQTAVVTGPAGEEIYTDKYGRVKVRFFWDRLSSGNETSSCWVRVATPWAGNQWGMIHIPRIGQEVVVDFLEGDPDQPLIVGSVYNSSQMPPYALPANQTQSGVKSRSSKGGTAAHFNEIRFEDLKDKEEIYVHAERNLATVVEAAESRSVGASRSSTIHRDDKLTVEKGNYEIKVLEKDQSTTIAKGNQNITVQLGNIESKVPAGTHRMEAKEILLTATAHLKLQCGGSTIDMTPAMITITAPMVKINC